MGKSLSLQFGTRILGSRILGSRILGSRILGSQILGGQILGGWFLIRGSVSNSESTHQVYELHIQFEFKLFHPIRLLADVINVGLSV